MSATEELCCPTNGATQSELVARVKQLKGELTSASQACEAARQVGHAGNLYWLLRKKWRLEQRLFEAESELRLLPAHQVTATE